MTIGTSSRIGKARGDVLFDEADNINNGNSGNIDAVSRVRVFMFFILFGFYLLILITPYGGEGLFKDADIFWHIGVGETIWRTKSVPRVDEFSHTFFGQPWIAKEWLGQL